MCSQTFTERPPKGTQKKSPQASGLYTQVTIYIVCYNEENNFKRMKNVVFKDKWLLKAGHQILQMLPFKKYLMLFQTVLQQIPELSNQT